MRLSVVNRFLTLITSVFVSTVVACAGLGTADGATIFSDDFDTAPIGGDPLDPPWDYLARKSPIRVIEVLEDTSDFFGEGTGNRYVRHADSDPVPVPVGGNGIGLAALDAFSAVSLATYSFDIYEPTGLGDDWQFRVVRQGAPSAFSAGNFLYAIAFDDGAIEGVGGLYSQGVAHHVDVVVNNDTSSLSYGSEVLSTFSADVWVDGNLVVQDVARITAGDMTGVGFIIGSAAVQEMFYDTVVVRDTAFVVSDADADFDADGDVDGGDVDSLVGEIVAGTNTDRFDLTGNGFVNRADLDRWLADAATANGFAARYLLGDADLDGSVNASDLDALGQNWLGHPNTWQLGDFNADGTVNAGDLNEIGQNWLASIPVAASPESVPEPSGIAFLYVGALLVVTRLKLRKALPNCDICLD